MSGRVFSLQQAVAVLLATLPGFTVPAVWCLSQDNQLVVGEFAQPGMGFVNMKVCDSCTFLDFQTSLLSLWSGIALPQRNWLIGFINSPIRTDLYDSQLINCDSLLVDLEPGKYRSLKIGNTRCTSDLT